MLSLTDAEVFGVDDITKGVICIKCRNTVDQIDGVIGICSRCSLSQRTDRCPRELVARLLIGSEVEEFKARTFTTLLKMTRLTVIQVLKSRMFNCTYNGNVVNQPSDECNDDWGGGGGGGGSTGHRAGVCGYEFKELSFFTDLVIHLVSCTALRQ